MGVIPPDPRGFAKVKQAARYVGCSERTLRTWLKEGLPHFRLSTGTILISYRDIDEWLKQFRVDSSKVDAVLNEIMEGLK